MQAPCHILQTSTADGLAILARGEAPRNHSREAFASVVTELLTADTTQASSEPTCRPVGALRTSVAVKGARLASGLDSRPHKFESRILRKWGSALADKPCQTRSVL